MGKQRHHGAQPHRFAAIGPRELVECRVGKRRLEGRSGGSKGVKREYVRVVETYRDRDGKTWHRTVINLGPRNLLAEHLDLGKLRRLLYGDAAGDDRVERKGAVGARNWGPLLVARRMWNDLGLEVETYTWDVLPHELRGGSKADAIARELA